MTASVLTPRAQAKLMDLRLLADHLAAMVNSTSARLSHLRSLKADETLLVEIGKLESHLTTQQEKAHDAVQLLAQLQHWLLSAKNLKLTDAPPVKFKLNGETHASAVAQLRLKLNELGNEFRAVSRVGPTRDELYQMAEKYADDLLAKAQPRFVTSHTSVSLDFSNPNGGSARTNLAAAMALLDREGFLKVIHSFIEDDLKKNPHRLSAENVAARLKDIRSEMLEIERTEEHLIANAAVDDIHISRRPTASAFAVLGLRIASADQANAA